MTPTLTQSQAIARLNAIRTTDGWKRPETAVDALVKRLPKWEGR